MPIFLKVEFGRKKKRYLAIQYSRLIPLVSENAIIFTTDNTRERITMNFDYCFLVSNI